MRLPLDTSVWQGVDKSLPISGHGSPYMMWVTKPVLVRVRLHPDYPIVAHAIYDAKGNPDHFYSVAPAFNLTIEGTTFHWVTWATRFMDTCEPMLNKQKAHTHLTFEVVDWMPLPCVALP